MPRRTGLRELVLGLHRVLVDPGQRGRLWMWSIAGCACVFSFRSIMYVSVQLGVADPATAWMIPTIIDGVVFYSTDTAWVRAKDGEAWWPFAGIAFAFNVLSMVANAVAHQGGPLTHVLGGVVPVAYQIALTIGAVENRRRATRQETPSKPNKMDEILGPVVTVELPQPPEIPEQAQDAPRLALVDRLPDQDPTQVKRSTSPHQGPRKRPRGRGQGRQSYSPQLKAATVARVLDGGEEPSAVAASEGVPMETFRKWVAREQLARHGKVGEGE